MSDLAHAETDPSSVVTPLQRPVDERAPPLPTTRLREALHRECEAMLRHALDRGKEIPPDVVQRVAQALSSPTAVGGEPERLAELTILHGELSALVAPARGRTLVLLEDERRANPRLYVFGPVRLVRQMLAFAVLALATTSILSTLHAVDVDNVAQGWFALSGGEAYAVLGFLLSVACLGAAFSNLSTINRYIEQANYDPTFEGSYWVRVVLGLISGVVLGEILFDLIARANATSGGIAPAGERIVLAFLGGFATAPVQRLLTNLSDAIGTLLQGRQQQAQRPPRTVPLPTMEKSESKPEKPAS